LNLPSSKKQMIQNYEKNSIYNYHWYLLWPIYWYRLFYNFWTFFLRFCSVFFATNYCINNLLYLSSNADNYCSIYICCVDICNNYGGTDITGTWSNIFILSVSMSNWSCTDNYFLSNSIIDIRLFQNIVLIIIISCGSIYCAHISCK
jgi:hypothetical protein